MEEEKYEKKYIIYLDDDNTIKKKVAYIKFENDGWSIKFDPSQKPFWISSNRVLKIKEATTIGGEGYA